MFQEFRIKNATLKAKKARFFLRKEQTIHLHLWGPILLNCYTVSTKENHVMSLNDVVTELYTTKREFYFQAQT